VHEGCVNCAGEEVFVACRSAAPNYEQDSVRMCNVQLLGEVHHTCSYQRKKDLTHPQCEQRIFEALRTIEHSYASKSCMHLSRSLTLTNTKRIPPAV
jgi:hypothetical protein